MNQVYIPKVGEGVVDVKLTKWLKKVGDFVEAGEVVAEISTDKVDSDVVSEISGKISKLFFKEGDDVLVGDPILSVGGGVHEKTPNSSDIPIVKEKKEKSFLDTKKKTTISQPHLPRKIELKNTIQKPLPTSLSSDNKIYDGPISPIVGKIMFENNIKNLDDVMNSVGASGVNKRITKGDLLMYLQQQKKAVNSKKRITPQASNSSSSSQPLSTINVPPHAVSDDGVNHTPDTSTNRVPMDRVRLLIADKLKSSTDISVHVTSFIDADITLLVEWKIKNAQEAEEKYQTKLTFTPIFIHALVQSLMKFPMFNSSISENNMVTQHEHIHIGLAAALPNGNLIVPVIRNAMNLNIFGLAKECNRLSNSAKSFSISPAECKGSTFSVSNIGAVGTLYGTPIINQPEVAILAIGAIKKKPIVMIKNGQEIIAIRSILHLSLSYDHRIIDGMLAGEFLKDFVKNLENFDSNIRLF